MAQNRPRVLTASERAVRVRILQAQIRLMRRCAKRTGDEQHARWLLKEVGLDPETFLVPCRARPELA